MQHGAAGIRKASSREYPTETMSLSELNALLDQVADTPELVREALRGQPIVREADPLASGAVDEHHVGRVVELVGLRGDAERSPDRRELRPRAEQELHAAGHVLLVYEALRAGGRVVGRVDRDAEHGHVVTQVVERAADALDGRRARIAAVRVDEREHHRAAAQARRRDPLAVL